MHTYIKGCVKIRRFWYCRFERNPSVSFVLIWVLLSLSQILRHSFLTHFAGLTIDCIDREPWFICLSLHLWECWDIFSFPCTLHMCLLSFSSLSWTSRCDFFSEWTSSPKWALSSSDSWARAQDCLTHGLLFCVLFTPFSHRATFTRNGVRMLAMPIRYLDCIHNRQTQMSKSGLNRNHVKLFSRVNRGFRGKKLRGNIWT